MTVQGKMSCTSYKLLNESCRLSSLKLKELRYLKYIQKSRHLNFKVYDSKVYVFSYKNITLLFSIVIIFYLQVDSLK